MNNNSILNGTDFGSIFLLFLPVALIIITFIYIKKKKQDENKEFNRFGRRGKKNHVWQIIKEYHKKKNKIGGTIEMYFLFERVHPADLEDYLNRAHKFRVKQEAKKLGIKPPKIKKQDFSEIKKYFDDLEEETNELNKKEKINAVKSQKIENIRDSIPKQRKRRKRYVILYKMKDRNVVSDWIAIEVELIKQNTKEGKMEDNVVINKELDVEMEMKWMEPLLQEKLDARNKKIEEDNKRALKEQKKKEKKSWMSIFKSSNKKI
ncbi:hypothetical protein MHSWG343_04430 [Candidatus Mycoplasma haematohominis]|uniref:Uncharacterized protein n=1 Tax=Candidatus Mycoplasma haematohominis TaxID=1494318 RepID=A0A478FST6_9MOLU|nr:hypothetical protein MHSWG343_04430 [Candidatus Mycoplasma haemohominis]